jgi:hypothetical protein
LNKPEGVTVAKLMLYQNPVLLNKEAHKNLRLKQSEADFSFAAKINSVILAEVECVSAARDYPIVFIRGTGEQVVPVALLGVRDDENLFVTNGKWRPNTYIPAFVRRYPFIPAETSSEKLMIFFDEEYAGFASDSGAPLFDEQGEPAALLKEAIALMQDYYAECKLTEDFTRLLSKLGLLKEVVLRVEVKDAAPFTLSGVLVVDEVKLIKVARNDVWSMFTNGHLASIYAHLFSQNNLGRLMDLLAERLSTPARGKTERSTKSSRVGDSVLSESSVAAATG